MSTGVGKLQFKKKNTTNQSNKNNIDSNNDKRRFSELKKEDDDQPNIIETDKVKKAQINAEDLVQLQKSGKTQAEIQFHLVRLKRLGHKIEKKMEMTYRQQIETFNKKIQTIPEHYDIPKVGPG